MSRFGGVLRFKGLNNCSLFWNVLEKKREERDIIVSYAELHQTMHIALVELLIVSVRMRSWL